MLQPSESRQAVKAASTQKKKMIQIHAGNPLPNIINWIQEEKSTVIDETKKKLK